MALNLRNLLLIALFASAVGCSKGGDKSNVEETPGVSEKASCQYGFNEGPSLYSEMLPSENIQTASFGKQYDASLMNVVMNLSGAETVRFVQKTGVTYYKADVAVSSKACGFTNSLTSASAEMSNYFKKSGDNILGLYLPKGSIVSYELNTHAGIIVKSASDRWTLVHEFMHHLFTKDHKSQYSDDEIKNKFSRDYENFKNSSAQLDSYGSKPASDYKVAITDYLAMSDDLVDILKRFFLEEMTIETLLGSQYDNGSFQLVYSGMRLNGAYYISGSAEKSLNLLKALIKANQDLKSKIYASSFDSELQNQKNNLDNDLSNLYKIQYEVMSLQYKADSYIYSKSLVNASLNIDETSHVGCSHEKDMDDVMTIMNLK